MQSSGAAWPGSLLASAIVVAAALVIATRLAGRGIRRALVLFALLFVPQVNNFVELLIFPLDLQARLFDVGAPATLDQLTRFVLRSMTGVNRTQVSSCTVGAPGLASHSTSLLNADSIPFVLTAVAAKNHRPGCGNTTVCVSTKPPFVQNK